ncbi:PLP-dependent aminotransferase family protein [Agromyces larvae]|uniref:PLP-dependent aminotransferase family protein n=1 Tax=Agromyces larvae TaxID=2929802 RepID=A0ABY4BYP5_9MICO|nr:PLP-dependent aminotransferase family protein [Agromyces larvae]UOE42991.1 PLP-dependent aminotransferase family protein [Agromyces larvae]
MAQSTLTARALDTLLGDWRGADPASAYRALAERLRLLVLDGRIPVETRLPAERDLADRLDLSRTTVTNAYRLLREQGYLHSVRGSGSVARLPGAPTFLPAPPSAEYLDLSKAAPPALPWLGEIARAAADDLPRQLGDSGFDPIGLPELRAALADRYTARGLPTSPEQIMVTIGAQHAIALIARTVVGRGDRAVIEAPTYPHAYEALRMAGARLVPVPVQPQESGEADDEAAALGRAFGYANPTIAYLMPDFQNPTGRTMPAGARELVLDAAARQGTLVIADETTAELDIDRSDPPLPFAAYGPAVLIGSLGKTVWGGLRIGWIRAERPLIRRLVAARAPGDLGTPILEQLMAARLVERMDEVLEHRREQLRVGRDRLEAALAESIPEWHVPHVDGGIATWVQLGAPVSSQLALAARTQRLVVAAGPRFGIDGAFERFLRLPICLTPDQVDASVRGLAAAWQSLGSVPATAEPGLLAEVV